MSIVRSGDSVATPDPLALPLSDFHACATMCDALLHMDRAANRLRAFANATTCSRAARLAETKADEIAAMERNVRSMLAQMQGVRDIAPLLVPNLAAGKG